MMILRELSAKCPNVIRCIGRYSSTLSAAPTEFYATENLKRRYYYVMNTRGQLFLEETKHKNIATCLRDSKFLRFFFRQLRRSDEYMAVGDDYDRSAYKYVSLCGKEVNYFRVDGEESNCCWVFDQFDTDQSGGDTIGSVAGDHIQNFCPEHLKTSVSGRVYFPILNRKRLGDEVGLLHQDITQTLDINMHEDELYLNWKGQVTKIETI